MLGRDAGLGVDIARTLSPLAARASHAIPTWILSRSQSDRSCSSRSKSPPLSSSARAEPGRVEVHEREQRESLRDRSHRVLRQQRGQPDGLVAQLAADCLPPRCAER